jgi:outer membrane lipoprotein carrier protein
MFKYIKAIVILMAITALMTVSPAFGDEKASEILDRLEKRYGGKNFSADFFQKSTLSALDISDTAEGRAWFSHPGKMRWEYTMPDRHIIVTDGETLWIHRPEENQVVKGDAAGYFGDGKGAGFLANFSLVSEAFQISLESQTDDHWRLKLIPIQQQNELSAIYLSVNRRTIDIDQVVTENPFGDTTRISLHNLTFLPELDASLFEFEIPSGTDVIQMD